MSDERRPTDGPEEARYGWYAYAPLGASGEELPDTLDVTWLGLSDDAYEGPYVSDDGSFDSDVDALRSIGVHVDAPLHADVMAWHGRAASRQGESDHRGDSPLFAEKQILLARLSACAPAGIQVEPPRTQPPRRFHPAALTLDEEGRFAAGRVPRISAAHDWTGVLPELPADLTADLRAWLADLPRSAWARPRRRFESARAWDAAVFVWEDRTLPLTQRLQAALGDGWHVSTVP